VSLLTGVSIENRVAMTGEITLRGQVLPVGGIKEKSLAAGRVGITTFILPKRNEPDLDDLPESLKENMTFILVDNMDDVLRAALPSVFKARDERHISKDQGAEQPREVAAAGATSAHTGLDA
jgi:ATP-dependent Lon protease